MSPVPKDRSKENVRVWLQENDKERREQRMSDAEYQRVMMCKQMQGKRDNLLK